MEKLEIVKGLPQKNFKNTLPHHEPDETRNETRTHANLRKKF
jgi:hypothetical protein